MTDARSVFRVALLSLTVLAAETTLFHLLQYTTHYLFALLIVSMALVGVALGSLLERLFPENDDEFFSVCALGTAAAVCIAPLKILFWPSLGAANLLLVLPFLFPGAYISRAFATGVSGQVYLADLVGAGLSLPLLLLAYSFLQTEAVLLGISAALALAGFFALSKRAQDPRARRLRGLALGTLVVPAALLVVQIRTDALNLFYLAEPRRTVTDWKEFNQRDFLRLVKSYDGLTSRTHVVQDVRSSRSSYMYSDFGVLQDSFRPETLRSYEGEYRLVGNLVEKPRIFIIGTSAQGIMKVAKAFTLPERILGSEISPAVVRMMTEDFVAESGSAYEGVAVRTGNALALLEGVEGQFDIITMMNSHSMPHMFLPGPPDYLHTVEAYRRYLERLTPGGFLMLEARPLVSPGEEVVKRIVATVTEALRQIGTEDPAAHFAIYSWFRDKDKPYREYAGKNFTSILVKRTPFTPAEQRKVLEWLPVSGKLYTEASPRERDYANVRWRFLKGIAEERPYKEIIAHTVRGEVLPHPQWDYSPITVKRPFSSQVDRAYPLLSRILFTALGIALLATALLVSCAGFARSSGLDSMETADQPAVALPAPAVLAQALFGLGFILLEVLFMQLYHPYFLSPTGALAVTLSVLLVCAGLGGRFLGGGSSLRLPLAGLAATLGGHLLLFGSALESSVPLAALRGAAVSLIGLSGFFMGAYFPFSLRHLRRRGVGVSEPLLFGINSLWGAVGGALVVYLAVRFDYFVVFAAGIVSYLAGSILIERTLPRGVLALLSLCFTAPVLALAGFSSLVYAVQFPIPSARMARVSIKTIKTAPQQILKVDSVVQHSKIRSPKSVDFSADGRWAIVNNMVGRNTTFIDRRTRTVASVVPYDGRACEMDVSEKDGTVWVSLAALEGPRYPKYIPEPAEGWQEYNFPSQVLALSPAGDTFRIAARVPVAVKPKIVALSPNEDVLLVSNFLSRAVSVIDTASRQEVGRIPVGEWPRGIAFTDGGRTAFVANMREQTVSELDVGQRKVRKTHKVKGTPRHILSAGKGTVLYVGYSQRDGKIEKRRARDFKLLATADTGAYTRTLALSKEGRLLFGVNYRSNSLSVVRTGDMAEVAEIDLPDCRRPVGLAVAPDGEVWVTCFDTNKVVVLTPK